MRIMNDFKISGSARTLHPMSLGDGSAVTLATGAHDLELSLVDGQIWLTRSRSALPPTHWRDRVELALAPSDLPESSPEDLWLGAGDTVRLPRGSTWVAQGWPDAGFTTRPAGRDPTARQSTVAAGGMQRVAGFVGQALRRTLGQARQRDFRSCADSPRIQVTAPGTSALATSGEAVSGAGCS
jgi:hypothetical protein